jgi:DNA-binding transcriptional ArsR family regulator
MIAARALIAATRLGVFDVLAERPGDAADVAARLELDPNGVQVLLTALHSMGYVKADDEGRYRIEDTARRLLTKSSKESIATFVGEFNAHQWDAMGTLEDVLRGAGAGEWHSRPPDPDFWEPYIRGLFELSHAEHDANAALAGNSTIVARRFG